MHMRALAYFLTITLLIKNYCFHYSWDTYVVLTLVNLKSAFYKMGPKRRRSSVNYFGISHLCCG